MLKYILFSSRFLFHLFFFSLFYFWIFYLAFGIENWRAYLAWSVGLVWTSAFIMPLVLLDYLKATNLKSRIIEDFINACCLRTGTTKIDVLVTKKYTNMVFYIPKLIGRDKLVIGEQLLNTPNKGLQHLIDDLLSKPLFMMNIDKLLAFYFGGPFLYVFLKLEMIDTMLTKVHKRKLVLRMIVSVTSILLTILRFIIRPVLGPFFTDYTPWPAFKSSHARDLIEMMHENISGINTDNEILKRLIPA